MAISNLKYRVDLKRNGELSWNHVIQGKVNKLNLAGSRLEYRTESETARLMLLHTQREKERERERERERQRERDRETERERQTQREKETERQREREREREREIERDRQTERERQREIQSYAKV